MKARVWFFKGLGEELKIEEGIARLKHIGQPDKFVFEISADIFSNSLTLEIGIKNSGCEHRAIGNRFFDSGCIQMLGDKALEVLLQPPKDFEYNKGFVHIEGDTLIFSNGAYDINTPYRKDVLRLAEDSFKKLLDVQKIKYVVSIVE